MGTNLGFIHFIASPSNIHSWGRGGGLSYIWAPSRIIGTHLGCIHFMVSLCYTHFLEGRGGGRVLHYYNNKQMVAYRIMETYFFFGGGGTPIMVSPSKTHYLEEGDVTTIIITHTYGQLL